MKGVTRNINSTSKIDSLFTFLEETIAYRLSIELKNELLPLPELDLTYNLSHLAIFIKDKQLTQHDTVFFATSISSSYLSWIFKYNGC